MKASEQKALLFIRLVVGIVFLSEGLQKFLFPETLGTARFAQIGFPHPDFFAYFTGSFEIICGVFLLAGFLIRYASIPLIIIMLTAFVTTKWPLLVNKGFWPMLHEYRLDLTMTILLIYLIILGGQKK